MSAFSVEAPVQINTNEFGNNILGDAANEPTIAVDPNAPHRMVAVWRQFDDVSLDLRTAGWATSSDGGRSWSFHGAIEPGVFSSDPVLGVDAFGRFYALGLGDDFSSCNLHLSENGGTTWTGPIDAYGGDKPWMAVDPARRHVYVSWDENHSCCGDRVFTRSTDGGHTFDTPVVIDPAPTWGSIATGNDGEVLLCGILGIDTFGVARSDSARHPSLEPEFTVSRVDLGGSFGMLLPPNPAGLLGMPWVVVDPSIGPSHGTVYLLASVDPEGSDPLDVHLARSIDGGATWSSPSKVTGVSRPGWQWFGTLSVAPTGRLDVVWYESPHEDQPERTSVMYTQTVDGGDSWADAVAISPEFDSHLGWPRLLERLHRLKAVESKCD